MKIAIVHDWLTVYSGAERVLEELINLFPEAEIFTLIDKIEISERSFLRNKVINTSSLQRLPLIEKYYRILLPLFPYLIENFNLNKYDLVISSSSCVSKGVIIGPNQTHVCMCYSPMRYAYDLKFQYLEQSFGRYSPLKYLTILFLNKLKLWDISTSHSVDHFIAISKYISKRIEKSYRRSSVVIYPPVFIDQFYYKEVKKDFYLVACRLVPYKLIPLIIEAFNQMPDKKLVVVGDGPDYTICKKIAKDNIVLKGRVKHETLVELMADAKAYVYAAIEDFGIAPIEAQASGTPVIAYKGGALPETVVFEGINKSAILFEEQNTESIINAINKFETLKISSHDCRLNAERFNRSKFREEIMNFFNGISYER